MSQEEVTFKLYLLETELKRINATIVLNLRYYPSDQEILWLFRTYFCTVRDLGFWSFSPKNLLLGLYKPKIQTVWYVTSSILIWMVCQNWIELNTLVNNVLVCCKRIFLDKSRLFLPYGKFNNCTRLWNEQAERLWVK